VGLRPAVGLVPLLAVSAAVAAAAPAPPPRAVVNPIQAENARPGTTAWERPQANPGVMDAYTSEVSAAPGGTVHLHVSTTPAASYRVEIIRLGWYGGAGGRLVGCLPSCTTSRAGAPQDTPAPDPASGLLQLSWPVTDTIAVGRDWVSGYYYLDVVLTSGPYTGETRHVPLIVRAPPGRQAAILAQAAVNTWQAYNSWGGLSLYSKFGAVEGSHVSFSRPYDLVHQSPASWELAAVHFLERYGYDVSYTTDVDVDRAPASLLPHALVITLGHDEYWTTAMRDAFERARDAGVNLAFLGANDGYWQIRYEDDRRTLVEYRNPDLDPEADPARKTTTFRGLRTPRPECELLGIGYGQVGDSADYAVNDGALADPWFGGTGFTAGSSLHGLVGYEWNGVEPGCRVPPLTVFFHHEVLNGAPFREGTQSNADAVRYTAPSGARVFSAGSLQFSWGLDPLQERYDERLDRFMRNGLDDLTRPPAPAAVSVAARRGGIVVGVPPTRGAQVRAVVVYRHRGARDFVPDGSGVVRIDVPRCSVFLDHPGRGVFRYAVAYASGWRPSAPVLARAAVRAPASSVAPRLNRCLRPM
jgi:hypothetical protein